MSTAHLTIDLDALADNWQALNARTTAETAAVVKADGYGLGAARVAARLARAGARTFFVAAAEEGAAVRKAVGPDPMIGVFSGHMEGDAGILRANRLTPMINSVDQMLRHVEQLPGHRFGVQLDTGMNRLGLEPEDWAQLREIALRQNPALVMSHLACADEPGHDMNRKQLRLFKEMTDGIKAPRSLAATGGILLGPDYHFDLCRPGVGLYGGEPFDEAKAVVTLDLPVIQVRDLAEGETVGYGNSWTAPRACRIATVAAGYADGLHRAMGRGITLFAGKTACPVVGRISMDLITVDVSGLDHEPASLQLLNRLQTVDDLAEAAGTIGYEILTSMGRRYRRSYVSCSASADRAVESIRDKLRRRPDLLPQSLAE
ncbi:alanine racemase [Ruegeria pomeroyi]|nr:alanine racemase [Ruegeria pomeroyi]NVK98218.1 alanine racemase [Ruegeria pomeroyi]NVL03195.1 alanine racemase [Ruegeria pomeroyi]QWV09481.1 alanine racemase [Ruegeria pomeroyi]HCE70643.1 alanine racemase [Ruegeria sp.]